MRQRHPDLPGPVRPIFWTLRALGVFIALVSVVCATWLALRGEWGYALWALVFGIPPAVLPWLHPMSVPFAAVLAALGLLVGFIAQSWFIAAILVGVAVLLLWSMGRPVGAGIEMSLQEVESGSMMKRAHRHVEAFTSAGFDQVGAYGGRYRWSDIIATLLHSPDARSYASVTDVLWHMTSVFPDGRRLLTRNSHHGTLPPNVLVNPMPGATPQVLIASHARALEVLAEHGHTPVPVHRDELVGLAIETEIEAMQWGRTRSRTAWSRVRATPLWDRPDAAERIAAWRGATG